LRVEAEVRRFVDQAAEHFGGVHTAIYAAGPYIPMRFISQQPAAAFREVMEHDTFGCFNLIQAVLPHLRTSKGSFTALVTPAIRRYAVRDILSAAPKAAIEALVKGLAAEEGRFGIRANAVGVGVITDGLYHALVESGDFDQRFLDASRQVMALKRLGTAEEVAEGVVFLASSRARWITGQTLMVDGGYAL
jgi:3-oxoacyl-[acyl-carrier protein] reductase